MSKKEKFTNCFGEEMERQVEQVEEKIGVEIDKNKFVAEALEKNEIPTITLTKGEFEAIKENVDLVYPDYEQMNEYDDITEAVKEEDWLVVGSLSERLEAEKCLRETFNRLTERIKINGVEEKEKSKSGNKLS